MSHTNINDILSEKNTGDTIKWGKQLFKKHEDGSFKEIDKDTGEFVQLKQLEEIETRSGATAFKEVK